MIKIELTSANFLINGNALTFPISVSALEKILGKSRLSNLKHGKIFTWDEVGIIGRSANATSIENLYICLVPKKYVFSPTNIFKGEFLLHNQDVIEYRKKNTNNLIKSFKGDIGCKFNIAETSCWYDIDDDTIIGIELQKDDGNAYEIPMKLERQNPISIDDKFSYLIPLWEAWKVEIIKTVPIDNEYFNLKYGITESEATQHSKISNEITLPDELIAFYKIYDVVYDAITSPVNISANGFDYYVLPFLHIKTEWENIQALQFGDDLEESSLENFSDKVQASDYANPRWIPFAEGKNGDYLLYDTDPSAVGSYGQIIELQNESWERIVVADSLSELLQKEIDLLANGGTTKFDFIMGKR